MSWRLLAVVVLVALAAPAQGIVVKVRAETTADWSCDNEEDAYFHFGFFVTVTQPESFWVGGTVDWETFAYSDCNLFQEIYSNGGLTTVHSGGAGVLGMLNDFLACPAQGRNTIRATLSRPGVSMHYFDTSFCAQPCAPILCHGPNDCDVNY